MMRRFARVERILVEPVGHLWAVFSPATGETVLLNDESAAILEILEMGPADADGVCAVISVDSGIAPDELLGHVEGSWPQLIEAGLVRELPQGSTLPQ